MSNHLTLSVPAILAASVFAFSINVTSGRAADECLRAPNATAPKGSHWYYRVDRATKRHCWYLGAQGQKVSRQTSFTARKQAPRVEQSSRATQASAQSTPASRQAVPSTEVADGAEPIASRFSQFWRNLYAPAEITRQAPALISTSYAEEPAQVDVAEEDMPLVWPVLTAAETAAAAAAETAAATAQPVVRHEYMLGTLVGALALAGIMMALIYRLASIRWRQPQPARWQMASHDARTQMHPFGGAASRTNQPARKLAPPKPAPAKRAVDLDRETHEARRLRELREISQNLESRLQELRDARRRSAA